MTTDRLYTLTAKIPPNELTILENYCKKAKRTKTEVIRELIRSLSGRVDS
jgi:hypothetical protein